MESATLAPTKDGSHLIVDGDYLQTLINCEGYYNSPLDGEGQPTGPVVGYTATYEPDKTEGKKWVGFTYFNFSKADVWPAVLTFYAQNMSYRLIEYISQCYGGVDVIVGAPWAGLKFSQEVARLVGCRHTFAEKNGDELILGRYEGEIRKGDIVVIGEELVNNTSTTAKLVKLIEDAGGIVVCIICAINRSYPFRDTYTIGSEVVPIMGVIEQETPQYKQDDPAVAPHIANGNFIPKPKYAWSKLKLAMDAVHT